MGGHNTQVFLATQMRITFKCPVSVVPHGGTLGYPRYGVGLPLKLNIQRRQEISGVVAS